MKKSIFDFEDYRDYLKALMSRNHGAKRGVRVALARAIPCQVSYLSRILNDETNLSLEQAEATNRFFNHTQDESHYFYLLLQRGRAGTPGLKSYFYEQITRIREERNLLKKRVGVDASLSRENQSIYYSAWHYAAVHVMSGIPELQTEGAMSERLRIPLDQLREMLHFLSEVGLIQFDPDSGVIKTGLGKIHLEKDSPMIPRHHANWRIQALRALELRRGRNIHYSVIINVSKEDGRRLERMISDFIEEFWRVVHPSNDEETFAFNLDFFRPEF